MITPRHLFFIGLASVVVGLQQVFPVYAFLSALLLILGNLSIIVSAIKQRNEELIWITIIMGLTQLTTIGEF